MKYFDELPTQVQEKACENLAYELLDSYIEQHEAEETQERLMSCLANEIQPHYSEWYAKYKEITK